jgi:hypothetical protein
MGSYIHPRAFQPLDLEIMDRVYEPAWAALQARDPFRDRDKDGERQESLRKLVFNNTRARAGLISTSSATGCSPICPRTGLCSQFGVAMPTRPVTKTLL